MIKMFIGNDNSTGWDSEPLFKLSNRVQQLESMTNSLPQEYVYFDCESSMDMGLVYEILIEHMKVQIHVENYFPNNGLYNPSRFPSAYVVDQSWHRGYVTAIVVCSLQAIQNQPPVWNAVNGNLTISGSAYDAPFTRLRSGVRYDDDEPFTITPITITNTSSTSVWDDMESSVLDTGGDSD